VSLFSKQDWLVEIRGEDLDSEELCLSVCLETGFEGERVKSDERGLRPLCDVHGTLHGSNCGFEHLNIDEDGDDVIY
jgi:hypothetical protein